MRDIYDILAKHFAGESTAAEEALVAQWKADNGSEYKQLSSAWSLIPDSFVAGENFKEYDVKAALKKIEPLLKQGKKETKVFRINHFLAYAAAACGAILLCVYGFWPADSNLVAVLNTGDSAKKVELPDGSTVWLAAGSNIEYNENFKEDRKLSLDGEAFFEVQRDTIFPFVVETSYGNVEVLGTAFNVETKVGGTEVSVDHGLVAFKNNGEEIKLAAGQSAISDKSGVSEIVPVDANYLSWKSGEFHFENTPLEEVIAEMNKFYPETITFERMTTKNLAITGDFNNRPVEELIEVIVLTCGLNAEYGEGTISLK